MVITCIYVACYICILISNPFCSGWLHWLVQSPQTPLTPLTRDKLIVDLRCLVNERPALSRG
ncbi:hypothetical protein I7I48_11820 [Histoplasma ohiense]|nr:hypothetical protein I7I48_11820 [Histoplasma ohiense (nom. inval.)]